MSKREATSTLLSIWKTITPYDVKLAFEKAISIYTDDLDDSNYSEDIEFEKKINGIIDSKYFPKEHYGKFKVSGIEVSVTSLRGYHLKNNDVMRMIYVMALLGIALLLSATPNYVLISLSSLAQRAKIIGVHKCNGANAGDILSMFLWETALVVGISLLLVIFVILNFSEKIEELAQISLDALFSFRNLWAPLLVVLFLFVVGGVLPGVAFSSIPVTQVFRRYTESKRR